MKILAYYPIVYGSEYLSYSMESIREHVDHIAVFYSSVPTYGHKGNIPNPDTKEDIENICNQFDAELLDITNNRISRENQHRQLSFDYARTYGYDIVLAVDYDEVWQDVDKAIEETVKGEAYQYQIAGSQWRHFWKSFNEINVDGFAPVRLFNLNNHNRDSALIEKGIINHFGYAISDELMEYKWSVHGHKNEMPLKWFTEKWYGYQKGVTSRLHPASKDVWIETQDFDKTLLPAFMRGHPLYEIS